mgnify:CR=1 FL=1
MSRLGRILGDSHARYQQVRAQGPGHEVRIPVVTMALAASVLAAALATRPVLGTLPVGTAQRWGWSADLLTRGHWWRLGSALMLTRDPFMAASMATSLGVAVGAYEYLAGHGRALAVAVGGALAGSAIVGAMTLALGSVGWQLAVAASTTLDYGFSAGVAAASGAVAATLRHRPTTVVLTLVVAGGLVLHHQIADWEHAASFSATFAALRWAGRSGTER